MLFFLNESDNDHWQEIEHGKYNVVTINPEILMGNEHIEDLWKKPKFTNRILSFVFDEAHCISQWGDFRNEYCHVGALRWLIPSHIPFYVPSATLPSLVLKDIQEVLRLRENSTTYIKCSNDRPEIGLAVRQLAHPAKSFKDLDFLIPDGFREDDPPPPKFLVFFDNKKEAEAAALHLQSRLPKSLQTKVNWFHSINTSEFREEEVENLRDGSSWGECCTDSFGMVSKYTF